MPSQLEKQSKKPQKNKKQTKNHRRKKKKKRAAIKKRKKKRDFFFFLKRRKIFEFFLIKKRGSGGGWKREKKERHLSFFFPSFPRQCSLQRLGLASQTSTPTHQCRHMTVRSPLAPHMVSLLTAVDAAFAHRPARRRPRTLRGHGKGERSVFFQCKSRNSLFL